MTNIHLLQVMGNIDSKFIAEAAPDVPQRKSDQKVWLKWASLAACLVLIVGTVLWTPMLFGDPLPTDLDNMIWDTFGSMQPSIDTPLWEGWRVDYSLYEQLEKAEDEQYFALHIGSRKTPWEESFVYEGKTFAEIQAEIEEKDNLIFKLQSLLKDGPHLKYGELLYTEGTPEGIKWSQSVYNKKISYYGKDFLAKYITYGEFHQSAVEAELSKYTAEARELKKICNESYDAYYSHYDESTEKLLSDLGICTVVKNNVLFIFIQKQELATLSVLNKEDYHISLATRRRYEHKEGDIPTFKNNVTGFALEKIECQAPYERFRITSSTSSSDAELIDKINTLIKEGQFDTDRLQFSITSSEAMSEDIFKDMNYDSITILRKTQKLAWISIKYENLDLEALKDLSNMEIIEYIGISLADMSPDTPD